MKQRVEIWKKRRNRCPKDREKSIPVNGKLRKWRFKDKCRAAKRTAKAGQSRGNAN